MAAKQPLVYVAKSKIHGKGLFAARRIRKGQRIGVMEGTPTKRDARHVLWIYEDDDTYEGLRVENEFRYANHSSAPNARLDGATMYALKTIQADEEITWHYGEDWEDVA